MSEVYMNMCRRVCRRAMRLTDVHGAFAVTVRLTMHTMRQRSPHACEALPTIPHSPAVKSGLQQISPVRQIATEERLRSGNRKIKASLWSIHCGNQTRKG